MPVFGRYLHSRQIWPDCTTGAQIILLFHLRFRYIATPCFWLQRTYSKPASNLSSFSRFLAWATCHSSLSKFMRCVYVSMFLSYFVSWYLFSMQYIVCSVVFHSCFPMREGLAVNLFQPWVLKSFSYSSSLVRTVSSGCNRQGPVLERRGMPNKSPVHAAPKAVVGEKKSNRAIGRNMPE